MEAVYSQLDCHAQPMKFRSCFPKSRGLGEIGSWKCRQGEMARWVSGSGRWMDCHFVLTRCGFLHWFNNSPPAPADIVPADSLNLSRRVPYPISACHRKLSAAQPEVVVGFIISVRQWLVPWLCRCQFETGEAPEFNLVEMGPGMFGRSRRLIFRASNVEECCEWAIGLREAIRGN